MSNQNTSEKRYITPVNMYYELDTKDKSIIVSLWEYHPESINQLQFRDEDAIRIPRACINQKYRTAATINGRVVFLLDLEFDERDIIRNNPVEMPDATNLKEKQAQSNKSDLYGDKEPPTLVRSKRRKHWKLIVLSGFCLFILYIIAFIHHRYTESGWLKVTDLQVTPRGMALIKRYTNIDLKPKPQALSFDGWYYPAKNLIFHIKKQGAETNIRYYYETHCCNDRDAFDVHTTFWLHGLFNHLFCSCFLHDKKPTSTIFWSRKRVGYTKQYEEFMIKTTDIEGYVKISD